LPTLTVPVQIGNTVWSPGFTAVHFSKLFHSTSPFSSYTLNAMNAIFLSDVIFLSVIDQGNTYPTIHFPLQTELS
jgi:hypothetical protein